MIGLRDLDTNTSTRTNRNRKEMSWRKKKTPKQEKSTDPEIEKLAKIISILKTMGGDEIERTMKYLNDRYEESEF